MHERNKDKLSVSVECDYRDLERVLELTEKLKFELIEIEKQLKKIGKLGITKRQLKQAFKKWFRRN